MLPIRIPLQECVNDATYLKNYVTLITVNKLTFVA